MGYIGNQITTVFPTSISVDSATINGNTNINGDTAKLTLTDTSSHSANTGAEVAFFSKDSGGTSREVAKIVGESHSGSNEGNLAFQTRNGGTLETKWKIFKNGNMLPSNSAYGIYLGTTSVSDSNLLDDYEEGSWTPSVAGNTTYNNQRGRYVKIGNQVNLWFYIQINQRNSPGVPYIVGGSPFTNSSQVAGSGLVHYFQSIQNSAVVLTCRIDTGGSNINVSGATGSSTTIANVNHDWVGNGSEVYGFVTHYVGS